MKATETKGTSDRAFDSLFESVMEVAGEDTTVAEVKRVTEELYRRGVRAWAIRHMLAVGLTVTLGAPSSPEPRQWYPAIQRWAVACRRCGVEVVRGELASLGKLPDQSWVVECASCREVDPACSRAASARTWSMSKDDDPDGLLAAIIEHSPADLRQEIEDDLSLALEAGRG